MCGILFFYNPEREVINDLIVNGLKSISNRGRDSCGMYCYNTQQPLDEIIVKRYGTVKNALNNTKFIRDSTECNYNYMFNLIQTRYITSNQKSITREQYIEFNEKLDKLSYVVESSGDIHEEIKNIYNETPPLVKDLNGKTLSIIHNGNIKVAQKFKEAYNLTNPKINTDTEIIMEFIYKGLTKYHLSMQRVLSNIITNIDGAFNFIISYGKDIYAMRDSLGMRPLVIGKCNNMICITSESSLFNKIGFCYHNEISPGEIVRLRNNKLESIGVYAYHNNKINPTPCALEYVYLMNNESTFNNVLVKNARMHMGQNLFKSEDDDFIADVLTADPLDYVVSYVPNTAYNAAVGYSKISVTALREIINVKTLDRTFIIANKDDRMNALDEKFEILDSAKQYQGKKLILIDDSIVRGNTLFIVVKKIKETGIFKEIHVRSASPPVKYQDYMGIDIPTRSELVANKTNEEGLAALLKVDSIKYLSESNLIKSIKMNSVHTKGIDMNNSCLSWTNGKYPIEFEDKWKLYSKIFPED